MGTKLDTRDRKPETRLEGLRPLRQDSSHEGLVSRSGGGKRDRTADLLHAMQALSQLSYTPTRRRGLYGTAQRPANPGRACGPGTCGRRFPHAQSRPASVSHLRDALMGMLLSSLLDTAFDLMRSERTVVTASENLSTRFVFH